MSKVFLRPRLIGERFDSHSVPLDLLKDFAVLEEMLLEIAKRNYLADNQDRQRLPKGFGKHFSVNLAAVEQGSVVLDFALASAVAVSSPIQADEEKYLNQAKDQVLEAVFSATTNEETKLEPSLLRYFDRFGRSLRADECIEFTYNGETVSFNQNIRKTLLEKSQASSWREHLTLKGYISALDKKDQTFDLQLISGLIVKAPFNEPYQKLVSEAFNAYESKSALVEVTGLVLIDKTDTYKCFESVEQFTPLDPLDLGARLEALLLLKEGWLDGKGQALNKEGAKKFESLFERFYDDALTLPYVYPTAEGNVQAEWLLSSWEVSLEVDLTSLEAEFHAMDISDDKEKALRFSLVDQAGWQKLNQALLSLSEVQA